MSNTIAPKHLPPQPALKSKIVLGLNKLNSSFATIGLKAFIDPWYNM